MALEKHIKKLTDILRREIRSFTSILELLILEEKCLVKCDSKALAEILERQEDLFSSVACLEKSRIEIIEKISQETGDDPYTFTVPKLAELVEGHERNELEEAGHILFGLNEDIQRKKASNAMLINQSIMLVESDIRMILDAVNREDNPESGYNSQAESESSSKSVCIDEKM